MEMVSRAASRWLQLQRFAIFLYLLFGALLIRQKPGLQYDEALLVRGAVHLRHSPHQDLPLPHDPRTRIHVFGFWFPLMTARYVGAINEFVCLPLFAWFGPRTSLVRAVSLLFGAVGLWGIGRLIREQVSPSAGALVSILIAVNPAYAWMTVFDNNAVGISMATLGLCCVALSQYLLRASTRAAFVVGLTLGFAIWARANFIWVIIAVLAATVLTLGKQMLVPRAHWIVAGAGAILGGLPFLIYQAVSRGGTWQALDMFATQDSLGERLLSRLVMFSETLLAEGEHRAMWNGPPMPVWERWLFPLIVLGACAVCLASRKVWPRVTALAFVFLGAILLYSRLEVSEHHLVELLPFAVAIAVFASSLLTERFRISRAIIAALALLYIASALYWQGAAIQGLRATGGVGIWSDALIPLAEQLERNYPTREIKILDWGLQDNLYVVTDGRLQTREMFWNATREQSGVPRPWIEEIRDGGIFVLNGSDHRQLPAASEGFLEAFQQGNPEAHRIIIPQRNGAPYAEIFDIVPNTVHIGPVSSLRTGDARRGNQLEGFHPIAEAGWRWTKREFAVILAPPELPAGGNARLTLDLYVPDTTIAKLGPITISAQLNHHPLKPETYAKPGSYTLTRDVPGAWLSPGSDRIEFSLDKALEPTATETRELGVVVSGTALAPAN
jgi:hypothetical protein